MYVNNGSGVPKTLFCESAATVSGAGVILKVPPVKVIAYPIDDASEPWVMVCASNTFSVPVWPSVPVSKPIVLAVSPSINPEVIE